MVVLVPHSGILLLCHHDMVLFPVVLLPQEAVMVLIAAGSGWQYFHLDLHLGRLGHLDLHLGMIAILAGMISC